MLMDAKKLSALIREKKKALMSDPEVASSEPAMGNANTVEDQKQLGRIEETLHVPEKSSSDQTMMDMSRSDAATAGLTDEQKGRMGRLRAYFDKIDLW